MAVAMTGAAILTRPRNPPMTDARPMAMRSENADEGPREPGLEAAGDDPGDAEHQRRVKDGVADPQVRNDRELSERRQHRQRRGKNELHVGVRSSADEPTVGRKAGDDRDDG